MSSPGVKEWGELPPSLPIPHTTTTTNKLLPSNNKTRVLTLQQQRRQQHHNYNIRRTRTRRLVVDNSSSGQTVATSQPRLQTRAEWHKDPRRKESLATKFNTGERASVSSLTIGNLSPHKSYHASLTHVCAATLFLLFLPCAPLAAPSLPAGGNNVMWDLSVQYLLQLRVVDVDGWLQALAPSERRSCLLMTYGNAMPDKGSRQDGGRGSGSGGAPWSSALMVTLQNWYDAQCGLCLCDKNYSKND